MLLEIKECIFTPLHITGEIRDKYLVFHLSMCMLPCPLVMKNKSPSLFQEISFTSNLNCSSALDLCVLMSMKVMRSSLLPTAIVLPSGDQQMLMFSPVM